MFQCPLLYTHSCKQYVNWVVLDVLTVDQLRIIENHHPGIWDLQRTFVYLLDIGEFWGMLIEIIVVFILHWIFLLIRKRKEKNHFKMYFINSLKVGKDSKIKYRKCKSFLLFISVDKLLVLSETVVFIMQCLNS